MFSLRKLALAAGALLLCWAPAHAGVVIGVGFGYPYYHPWHHYYRPWGVYIAPPPVVIGAVPVAPAPVTIVQPVPVVQTVPAPQPTQAAAPSPNYPNSQVASNGLPLAPVPVNPVADNGQAELGRQLARLTDPDERVRADACVQLGRQKTPRAIDPLAATLAGDRSPAVREAAARALGIIGSPNSLPALQRAAQADGSNDVRHSAQFAIEIIQAR